MKSRKQFDLVIIGGEAAGLAAAACAAMEGRDIDARVALVRTGDEQTSLTSTPAIPDFVWRRLDLQNSAYRAKPVEAMVSLFDDGRVCSTFAGRKRTAQALSEAESDPRGVYADFADDLARAWASAEPVLRVAARGGARLPARFSAEDGDRVAARLVEPLDAVLDDYFDNDALKAHLASAALMPFGLAGDEPGSALALAALSEPASWRVRAQDKGASVVRVFEEAAKSSGVEFFDAGVRDVRRLESRDIEVELENGERLRTAEVMASTMLSPTAARFGWGAGFSPLARSEGASAEVRVKLAKAAPAPAGHKHAIYFAPGSAEILKAARDAALEGRLPDEPPIYFEFHKDEIIVRAPYCPAALYADDEPREWSEQDRQMLGRLVVERLGKVLNGAMQDVRKVDVKITQRTREPGRRPSEVSVIVPPATHDEIGAAARLAMELVLGR